MRDNVCLVNDVAKAHGGKQMMLTPGGVQLPLSSRMDYHIWSITILLKGN